MSQRGTLYIIAAPSGAGKTSIVECLVASDPHLKFSISYTTRPARSNEMHGENYFFVDEKEYKRLKKDGAFLEHAKVFEHYYATSREWVENILDSGDDVILDIDWQGAAQIRSQLPESVGIFILPPALSVLEQRLTKRAQDNPQVIEARMAKAHDEISHYHEFDYLVVNDDFAHACADIQSIIRARRLKMSRQKLMYQSLIKELQS